MPCLTGDAETECGHFFAPTRTGRRFCLCLPVFHPSPSAVSVKPRVPVRAPARPSRKGVRGGRRLAAAVAFAGLTGHAAARGGPPPPESFDPHPLRTELPEPVAAAMQRAGLPLESLGFYAQAVDAPRALVALNAEQPYVLASTTKIVTSLAALDLLGAGYRWQTQAVVRGTLKDGRLEGDLVIVGGGDATLGAAELGRWFAQLQANGVREITGDIVIDRLAFRLTDADHRNTPRPAPDRPHHAWPNALSVGDGVLRVRMDASGGRGGGLALSPPLADVTVRNETTPGRRCDARAEFAGGDGRLELHVKGSWTAACGERAVPVALMTDADLAARAIAALWKGQGGVLHGRVVERSAEGAAPQLVRTAANAAAPAAAPLASLASPRLPQLLKQINKTSDNLASRQLLLTLAPGFPKVPATLLAARKRVHEWLRSRGIAEGDIEVDNGSGLARTERGKPRAMVSLLRKAWSGRDARSFVESLPIAGVDGTLANRLRGGAAMGRAQLKTGTLDDARALAGYVRANSGTVYAVAAMLNHPSASAGSPALDALIEWLVVNG